MAANLKHKNKRQMTKAHCLLLFLCMLAVTMAVGCARSVVPIPAPSALPRNDSYVDLKAGWTLRIVMPVLKSGGFRADLAPQKTDGNTISLSTANLIGYTISHYSVIGKGGEVRLRFVSAEETREGKTAPSPTAPQLPFELPRKTEHVRLVYLVRVSQADHNMAILAAKRLDRLSAFTDRLKENPSVCHSDAQIFCSWVPTGIAVRAEPSELATRGTS